MQSKPKLLLSFKLLTISIISSASVKNSANDSEEVRLVSKYEENSVDAAGIPVPVCHQYERKSH